MAYYQVQLTKATITGKPEHVDEYCHQDSGKCLQWVSGIMQNGLLTFTDATCYDMRTKAQIWHLHMET